MIFFNIIEKNDIKENTPKEEIDRTIDINLINSIQEINKNKKKKTYFFL